METLAPLEIQVSPTKKSRLSEVDFNNIPFGKVYADHMFVADYEDEKWQNFRIEPLDNLSLSPANSALHYGQSVFEGLKAFRSESDASKILIFRPEQNARRLSNSAKRMCMPEIPEEVFMQGLHQLVDLDRKWVPASPNALYIRPFVFATDEYLGLRPSANYKFIILTSPVGSYYAEPVRVKVERHYARSCEGGTGFAKCAGNYAASLYPALQAQQQGYHQLLWTDAKHHEYIEESGSMNVMFVINDTLITAPATDTILPGITRKSVLQLAKDYGMKVEERHLKVTELIEAIDTGNLQEAFGAGTAATIAHIAVIGCDDQDYELPPIEGRKYSNQILKDLADIQRGRKEDPYGWVHAV